MQRMDIRRCDFRVAKHRFILAKRKIVGVVALVDSKTGLSKHEFVRAGAHSLKREYPDETVSSVRAAIAASQDDCDGSINGDRAVKSAERLGHVGRVSVVLSIDWLLHHGEGIQACGLSLR